MSGVRNLLDALFVPFRGQLRVHLQDRDGQGQCRGWSSKGSQWAVPPALTGALLDPESALPFAPSLGPLDHPEPSPLLKSVIASPLQSPLAT